MIYRALMGTYIDNSSAGQLQSLANLFNETIQDLRAAQHLHQTMERSSRVGSTLEWFELSALADILLGRLAHEALRVLIKGLPHEGTTKSCS